MCGIFQIHKCKIMDMEQGETIKMLCQQTKTTQKDLAKFIGKSETALSGFIKGRYSATPATIKKICEAFNIPVAVFYFLALSGDDIPEHKQDLFTMFKAITQSFINKIYF